MNSEEQVQTWYLSGPPVAQVLLVLLVVSSSLFFCKY